MLSDEQIKLRKGKFTASSAGIVIRADAREVYALWQEMTDHPDFVPEDFSKVWPVQLGIAAEPLNLRWFEMKYGPISRIGSVVYAFEPDWAAATLDAWSDQHKVPIECKAVGGREPFEVVLARYQPQLQWQMMVCDARECAFSVIIGGAEPIVEFIPRDLEYIEAQLLPRVTQFMQHVWDKTEPVDMPTIPAPALVKKIYDMSSVEQWKASADRWLQTHGAVEIARDNEKILKSLVPDDAKMAHGWGVRISRDRAGRLALREDRG